MVNRSSSTTSVSPRICIRLVFLYIVLSAILLSKQAFGFTAEQRTVSVGGKCFTVKVVSAPLNAFRVKVGLAGGRVGATESLQGIVKRYGAVGGINGSFFDAYTSSSIKPPFHNLATNGEIVHLGSTGTTLGFDADNDYRMGVVRIVLHGKVYDERKGNQSWYAYFMNHPIVSANCATVFTTSWVGSKTPSCGTQILMDDQEVKIIRDGAMDLKGSRYVLVLKGSEQSMARRFTVGSRISGNFCFEGEDLDFWMRAQEIIGCGPRLVENGQVYYAPTSEGFKNPKIISLSCTRSAVGITRDRRLLLVTCASATTRQLAGIMKALGSWDAMNLDGGASAGLWANGHYLTTPSRKISNALLILPK